MSKSDIVSPLHQRMIEDMAARSSIRVHRQRLGDTRPVHRAGRQCRIKAIRQSFGPPELLAAGGARADSTVMSRTRYRRASLSRTKGWSLASRRASCPRRRLKQRAKGLPGEPPRPLPMVRSSTCRCGLSRFKELSLLLQFSVYSYSIVLKRNPDAFRMPNYCDTASRRNRKQAAVGRTNRILGSPFPWKRW
jgi:hypothetical protein